MISPPILVSKANVMIGYNPIYEYAALPDVERIVAAIQRSVATKQERAVVAAGVDRGSPDSEPASAAPGSAPPARAETSKQRIQRITVPVMGEGIRNAKIVSLLKNPGDTIALDDQLCEVETDKAVYPIQSSFAGAMGEWKTKMGDTVEIGQELGTIITAEPSVADQFQEAARESVTGSVAAEADRVLSVSRREITQPGSPSPATIIEPALSPTITRKLVHVIPANLQIDARWDAIRRARDAAKRKNGKDAPSPSVMIAWAVMRAMEKHPPFVASFWKTNVSSRTKISIWVLR